MSKKKFDVDTVWIKNPSIDQLKNIIALASDEIDKCCIMIEKCKKLMIVITKEKEEKED